MNILSRVRNRIYKPPVTTKGCEMMQYYEKNFLNGEGEVVTDDSITMDTDTNITEKSPLIVVKQECTKDYNTVEEALEDNQEDIAIKLIKATSADMITNQASLIAIKKGYTDVVKRLFNKGVDCSLALEYACQTEQIDIIKYMRNMKRIIKLSLRNGGIDLDRLIHEYYNYTSESVCIAAENERADILKLFKTLDGSNSLCARMSIARYLYKCSSSSEQDKIIDMIDKPTIIHDYDILERIAITTGDLNLFKWVFESSESNRFYGPYISHNIIIKALSSGYFELASYAYKYNDHRYNGYIKLYVDEAIVENKWKVARWYYNHEKYRCHVCVLDKAAINGSMDSLQYHYAHTNVRCTSKALDACYIQEKNEVVNWLLKHSGKFSEDIIDTAIERNDTRAIQNIKGFEDMNIDKCYIEGKDKAVNYLLKQGKTFSIKILDTAIKRRDKDTIRKINFSSNNLPDWQNIVTMYNIGYIDQVKRFCTHYRNKWEKSIGENIIISCTDKDITDIILPYLKPVNNNILDYILDKRGSAEFIRVHKNSKRPEHNTYCDENHDIHFMIKAIKLGHLDILKYLININSAVRYVYEDVKLAADYGQTHIVKWLCEDYGVYIPPNCTEFNRYKTTCNTSKKCDASYRVYVK